MRSSPNHVQDAFHYTSEPWVIHQFDRSNPFWSHYRNICGPEMEFQKRRFTAATWWELTLESMCKMWEYVSSVKVFFFFLKWSLEWESAMSGTFCPHLLKQCLCAIHTNTLICNQYALPCQTLKQSNEKTGWLQVLIDKYQHQHMKTDGYGLQYSRENFKWTCSQRTH